MIPVVAVPACNEEEWLPRLLQALDRQTIATRRGHVEVVVVVNNTQDGTMDVLRRAARNLGRLRLEVTEVVLPPDRAHVGTARRLAMNLALRRIGARPHGVVLTTDADAAPAPDWIWNSLAAIAAGADLVGGRIMADEAEEAALAAGVRLRARLHDDHETLCDRLASAIDPLPYDPWPRHHDHIGASLAVRAEVYRAVGGLPPLPVREDLGLVRRVLAAGYRLVHPLDVKVTVSARQDGRAKGGMADCISSWSAEVARGAPILVEDPEALEDRLVRRRSIRDLAGLPPDLCRPVLLGLGAKPCDLPAAAPGPAQIGRLIDRLARDEPDAPRSVPVEQAIERLHGMIDGLEHASDAA